MGGMVKKAKSNAYEKSAALTKLAKDRVGEIYGKEIGRLKNLMLVNGSIKPEEVEFIEKEKNEISGFLDNAVLRLDMIKVICSGNW
jgi:hypothetical protein